MIMGVLVETGERGRLKLDLISTLEFPSTDRCVSVDVRPPPTASGSGRRLDVRPPKSAATGLRAESSMVVGRQPVPADPARSPGVVGLFRHDGFQG